MNIEIIGTAAGILSCATYVPQIMKSWKLKSVEDISPFMFIIAMVSTILWLVYGILIDSFSMIFTNVIVCILSSSMLLIMYRLRSKESKPSRNIS